MAYQQINPTVVSLLQDVDKVALRAEFEKIAQNFAELFTGLTASSQWVSGIGAPTDDQGDDGQFYLNEANGDVFRKENGVWDFKIDLQGAAGSVSAKLQTLDDMVDPGFVIFDGVEFARVATLQQSDIDGLDDALAGKAPEINGLSVVAPDLAADYFIFWDSSGSVHAKALLSGLPATNFGSLTGAPKDNVALSDELTDLENSVIAINTALDGKSPVGHDHAGLYIEVASKNVASGVAGLDADAKVPVANLPEVRIGIPILAPFTADGTHPMGMWPEVGLTATKIAHRTVGGTASIKIQKNGVDINGFGTAIALTTTATFTLSTEEFAEGDVMSLVISAASSLTGVLLTINGVQTT